MTASPAVTDVLNRLLVLHTRSLPMYLSFAPPWHMRDNPHLLAVMQNIVTLQKATADRLGVMIMGNNVSPDFGEFPMSFTGLHDLSAQYLLTRMIERQLKEITYIEKCVGLLSHAPYAQTVAQESLGEAKGHLEALRDIESHPEVAAVVTMK